MMRLLQLSKQTCAHSPDAMPEAKRFQSTLRCSDFLCSLQVLAVSFDDQQPTAAVNGSRTDMAVKADKEAGRPSGRKQLPEQRGVSPQPAEAVPVAAAAGEADDQSAAEAAA